MPSGERKPKVEIETEEDLIYARQQIRRLADELGFSIINKTRIATAVSEITRNLLIHGKGGYMEFGPVEDVNGWAIECIFIDHGPGIENIEFAIQDGFSTGTGLGKGLPGTKRLVDYFNINSELGKGTVVEIKKWN